jgi:hypothetical protein
MVVYQFTRIAVTNYYQLGGLQQQKFILTTLQTRSLISRCQQGCAPLKVPISKGASNPWLPYLVTVPLNSLPLLSCGPLTGMLCEIGVLDPSPKLLGFHMSGLATYLYMLHRERRFITQPRTRCGKRQRKHLAHLQSALGNRHEL